VDIIDARTDLVTVAVVTEGAEQLHVALGCLNGYDVGIEALDGREDVVEVGVAEMAVGLQCIRDASGGELERIDRPSQVGIPISATKRKLLSNSVRSRKTDLISLPYLHLHVWRVHRPGWP
jgi:hypothetical protein